MNNVKTRRQTHRTSDKTTPRTLRNYANVSKRRTNLGHIRIGISEAEVKRVSNNGLNAIHDKGSYNKGYVTTFTKFINIQAMLYKKVINFHDKQR